MAEIAVGIDLGTSNACVAVRTNGKVQVIPNGYGEHTIASVVNLAEDGSITVGNAAKANVIHDPENTVYSAKRLIGRYFFSEEVKKAQAICNYKITEGENHSVRITVRGEAFSLPEIGAMVLRELKSIAETGLGAPVAKAVITVPAYFNDNQRQATKDAARIAGLEVLRVLNEPTAAALAYGFGKGLNQRVAVYDLGGGTFDISVLEIGNDVFEVLATSGDTFLGGDDFDDRLIDLLADEFAASHSINLRNDPYALEKLKFAAEGAKKGLSVDDETQILIPDIAKGPDGQSLSVERTLTRSEFGSLVMDLIQRTFKVCDEALQQAGLIARDVDGVIMVGGPTRLPIIRNAVKEYFQQEPKDNVDPDEVVALGAAIHADSLINEGGSEAFLLDVTPLTLQIGVAGGLTETIIERNTPVPIEQTRTFTTFKDHQEKVAIRVYQGESREATDNELLGKFEFSDFEKGRRGEVEIDVTFEIDTDGIVNVTARDRATGTDASTRLTLSSGLSDQELQAIIGKGVADRVKPSAPESDDIDDVPLLEDDIVLLEPAADQAPSVPEPRARPHAKPRDANGSSGPIISSRDSQPSLDVDEYDTEVEIDDELDLGPDLAAGDDLEMDTDFDLDDELELDADMALDSPSTGPGNADAADPDDLELFEAPGVDLSSDDSKGN